MTDDNSPRLIGRKEAAAYCGIGESTFSLWVSTHKMPPAVPGTRKWDKRAIDARLDEISGLATEGDVTETGRAIFHRQPSSDYSDWKAKKLKRREKYKPVLELDSRLERILLYMAEHVECDTIDTIPSAGQKMMDVLVEKDAVRLVGVSGKVFRYSLTEDGIAEAARIKKWRALTP